MTDLGSTSLRNLTTRALFQRRESNVEMLEQRGLYPATPPPMMVRWLADADFQVLIQNGTIQRFFRSPLDKNHELLYEILAECRTRFYREPLDFEPYYASEVVKNDTEVMRRKLLTAHKLYNDGPLRKKLGLLLTLGERGGAPVDFTSPIEEVHRLFERVVLLAGGLMNENPYPHIEICFPFTRAVDDVSEAVRQEEYVVALIKESVNCILEDATFDADECFQMRDMFKLRHEYARLRARIAKARVNHLEPGTKLYENDIVRGMRSDREVLSVAREFVGNAAAIDDTDQVAWVRYLGIATRFLPFAGSDVGPVARRLCQRSVVKAATTDAVAIRRTFEQTLSGLPFLGLSFTPGDM